MTDKKNNSGKTFLSGCLTVLVLFGFGGYQLYEWIDAKNTADAAARVKTEQEAQTKTEQEAQAKTEQRDAQAKAAGMRVMTYDDLTCDEKDVISQTCILYKGKGLAAWRGCMEGQVDGAIQGRYVPGLARPNHCFMEEQFHSP